MQILQYARHAVQLAVLLALNGRLFGLAPTPLVVPYLWPSGATSSTAYGAFDAMEYLLSKGTFPILLLGLVYLTALTVGRVFCGWACPMGLAQDLLSYLPIRKQKLTPLQHNQWRWGKWVLLGAIIMVCVAIGVRRGSLPNSMPFGDYSDSPFSVISPSATMFAYLPWLFLWNNNALADGGMTAWVKLFMFVLFLVPSLYTPRFFCRYLCPLGAMFEPVQKYKMLRVAITHKDKASREEINRTLDRVCPMGVTVDDGSSFIEHPGCIHCGKCVAELPKKLQQTFSVTD
jgi:polyferredoxin